MRILYHHRTLADGAEGIHITAMVNAFRALGHEVRLVGGTGPAGSSDRRHLVERVKSTMPRALFELASIGLNLPEYLHLRDTFEQFKPDLLYKRHARYDVAALWTARRARVPAVLEVNTVFTAADYEQFERLALRRLARHTERKSFALSTVVVAVSTPLADEVKAVCRRDVVVLPNGADPDWFDPRAANREAIRTRFGLTGVTVGWTGILREWHGLELLLEAMVSVANAHLLIVGDGPARRAIEARVAALGLTTRVVMVGRVPHAEVRDYVAAMDIAVVADERTGVASPMKMLEYMSMGCAVVAPRLANITDVIDEGVDGLLFVRGDSRDLARRLKELTSDPKLRSQLAPRARLKVQQHRNWRAIARAVLASVSPTNDTD